MNRNLHDASQRITEAVEMGIFRKSVKVSRRERIRNKDIRHRGGLDGILTTDRKKITWMV